MDMALYARVSSDKQDVDLSVSGQLRALREFAQNRSYRVVKEYVDEAESGRTVNRSVFQEMIAASKRRPSPFEAILVWKLSRFARNREDSIVYKSLLKRHGVHVVSINKPLENTPTGKMMEGIIEVMDEFYSNNLGQDVTRGMREASSRGFWVSGRTPYGYRRLRRESAGGVAECMLFLPTRSTQALCHGAFTEGIIERRAWTPCVWKTHSLVSWISAPSSGSRSCFAPEHTRRRLPGV